MKNIRFYRIETPWPESEIELSALLEAQAFKPCGPLSEQSAGFEPPIDNSRLGRTLSGCDLLNLRIQKRVLPPAAVKEELDERIALFEQRTGTTPNRKERRDLKDEVYVKLLPQALLQSTYTKAFYIRDLKVLAIGAGSVAATEILLDSLREALGQLAAVPLAFDTTPGGMFRAMIHGGECAFSLGNSCKLSDFEKSSITYKDHPLQDSTIQGQVQAGWEIERLAIKTESLKCVLDQELVVRQLDILVSDAYDLDDEDPIARHDADFVLLSSAVRDLLRRLEAELKSNKRKAA